MDTITAADYIQYGFLAFICLLLVTIVAGMWRQFRDIGELRGQLVGINQRFDDLNRKIDGVEYHLNSRIDGLDARIDQLGTRIDRLDARIDQLGTRIDRLDTRIDRLDSDVITLREQVAENKGLLLSMHERMNLLLRHHHDEGSGAVVILPEEVTAD